MDGWKCPGCGRCYSPFKTKCGCCGPGTGVTTWPDHICEPVDMANTLPICKTCGKIMASLSPYTTTISLMTS